MERIEFGTGGWRAIIGKDFICENIRRVAKGIYLLMAEQNRADKPVIIGYDRRFLSETAAKWVAEVLTKNGITVWLMERSAPTPLIMHTVKSNDLWFGIEITASHNPATYNGIKLFTGVFVLTLECLVEQYYICIYRKCSGKRNPLFHTTGKF